MCRRENEGRIAGAASLSHPKVLPQGTGCWAIRQGTASWGRRGMLLPRFACSQPISQNTCVLRAHTEVLFYIHTYMKQKRTSRKLPRKLLRVRGFKHGESCLSCPVLSCPSPGMLRRKSVPGPLITHALCLWLGYSCFSPCLLSPRFLSRLHYRWLVRHFSYSCSASECRCWHPLGCIYSVAH